MNIKRRLGQSNIMLSPLGVGTWQFSNKGGTWAFINAPLRSALPLPGRYHLHQAAFLCIPSGNRSNHPKNF